MIFYFQDSNKYDDWRHHYYPNLAEVLDLLPSCKPQASLLTVLLPHLQPRFYSISSSPLAHPQRIHITVAVVVYKTQGKIIFKLCFILFIKLYLLSFIFNMTFMIPLQFTGGNGSTHYGVCSTYLQNRKPGDELTVFLRR